VTAVQVMPVEQPSQWQKDYSRFNTQQLELLEMRTDAKADALVTTSGK
jgi:formate dehydrogenase major subunit